MAKGMTINELVEMRNMRTVLVPPRPLTFEEFVDLFSEDDEVELIDGMVVRRMAARTPHEDLFGWLHTLLGLYAEQKDLGVVYGSRHKTLRRWCSHACSDNTASGTIA